MSFAPQTHVFKHYTGQLRLLLSLKKDLLNFGESDESKMAMLRAVNHILNWDTDRTMHSDVKRRQASIVAMETQSNQFCGSN